MNATVRTSAFKTGNSVAVRLPKAFGIKAGDELQLEDNGRFVRIERLVDQDEERAKVVELVRRLRELGPVNSSAPREPIEFPDRPGLY